MSEIISNSFSLKVNNSDTIHEVVSNSFSLKINNVEPESPPTIPPEQIADLNGALEQYLVALKFLREKIQEAHNKNAYDITREYTNAQIKVLSDSITQRVDRVEEKQTSVDGKVSALETWKSSAEQKITADAIINTVSSTITQAKNEAINEANSNTTNALQGYPTTTQMNSAIQQTANSINATVSSNYTDLNGKIQSANAAITQTAESIQSSISQQYYNKDEIEKKGYQTSSQVQQAVNSVKFSFQESGGYNLLKNSKWDAKKEQWTFTNDSYVSVIEDAAAGTNYLRCQTANGATHGCSQTIKVEKDNTYVASAKVDFDNGAIAVLRVQVNGSTYYAKTNQASQYRNKVLFVSFPVTASGNAVITLYTDSSSTTGKYARFRYSQVELGSEFSPWSPNPYEIYGGVATIDKDKVRIQHDNGSYSQMAVSGFKRFDSGTGRDYHYLSSNGVINVSNRTPVTVTLPSEFKGKDFKVTLSIFKVNIPSGVGWNGIYDIDSYTSNVDRSNAKFTVEAMVKSVNGQYGTVDISYVVIA